MNINYSLTIKSFALCIFVWLLTINLPSYISADNIETNSLFIITGTFSSKQLVDSPAKSSEVVFSEGNRKRIRVSAPFKADQIILSSCRLFVVDNDSSKAREIKSAKNIILLHNIDIGEPFERGKNYLFFAKPYAPPQEFISAHNLQESAILKVNRNEKDIQYLNLSDAQAQGLLQKYGIVFSQTNEDEKATSSNPLSK